MQSRNIRSFTAQLFFWYDNGLDGNRDDDNDLIKLILAADPLYSLGVGFDDDNNDDNDSLDDDGEMLMMIH